MSHADRVLLLSEDATLARHVDQAVGTLKGWELRTVADPAAAEARAVADPAVRVLLVHVGHEGVGTGLIATLERLAVARPGLVRLAIVEDPGVAEVRRIFECGVREALGRPLDLSRLAYLIEMGTLEARVRSTPARGGDGPELCGLPAGEDAWFYYMPDGPMAPVIGQIERVAPLDTTILLTGGTGTGKSWLARAIHHLSPHHDRPFLSLDCGTLSPQLIESELFGHVRGAFTGAEAARVGKLAAAAGGTLFLDEIDALPASLQTKLLRVVESRTFEAVGSDETRHFDARLIVASNRRLEAEIEAGRFRADLYYRLNVVSFELPPLHDRPSLIPRLARLFLLQFARKFERPVSEIDPDALRALQQYGWPGNVRELRNTIERAVALGAGRDVSLADLPPPLVAHGPCCVTPMASASATTARAPGPAPASTPAAASLVAMRAEAERSQILAALERNRYNHSRAAADLGISRMTLYNKLHKYGIPNGRQLGSVEAH